MYILTTSETPPSPNPRESGVPPFTPKVLGPKKKPKKKLLAHNPGDRNTYGLLDTGDQLPQPPANATQYPGAKSIGGQVLTNWEYHIELREPVSLHYLSVSVVSAGQHLVGCALQ